MYLSHNELNKLPDSICNLVKLQILFLSSNHKLARLPKNIDCLVDLGTLDLSNTKITQSQIKKLGKKLKSTDIYPQ